MSKKYEYLDGKLRLKDITLKRMLQVTEILQQVDNIFVSPKLINLFEVILDGYEDKSELENLNPKIVKKVLKDFFHNWKPLEYISENTKIQNEYVKSVLESVKDQETTKNN